MATSKKKPAAGGAITKWDAQLAELAKKSTRTVEGIGAGGNIIGTAGGVLKYKGAEIPENALTCVVLDAVNVNGLYEGKYNPDNPEVPVCFAFGVEDKTMSPHEKSAKPKHGDCKTCPNNEYGSADTGTGKACKNMIRLGVISSGDLDNGAEGVQAAEVAYIHVPPTSLKTYAGYARQVDELLHRPPLGVVTKLWLERDPKNQFKMLFKIEEKIDDGELIGALIEKQAVVEKEIQFPYIQIENAQKKPAKTAAKGKAKAAAAGGRRKF